jgi:hypothetical protein
MVVSLSCIGPDGALVSGAVPDTCDQVAGIEPVRDSASSARTFTVRCVARLSSSAMARGCVDAAFLVLLAAAARAGIVAADLRPLSNEGHSGTVMMMSVVVVLMVVPTPAGVIPMVMGVIVRLWGSGMRAGGGAVG